MIRFGSVVASVVLAVTGIFAFATPASADSLDTLSCLLGTSTTTYDPPISTATAPTTRTIDQKYAGCVGTGDAAAVVSGTHKSSNLTNRSCLQLLSTASVTWTITWNTGQTSTVETERVANLAGAVFTNTFTGVVTDGLLKGHTVVEQMTSPSTDITLCTLGLGTVAQLNSVHVTEIL